MPLKCLRCMSVSFQMPQGWEQFTEAAISKLSERRKGLVFLLWGRFAQVGGACGWCACQRMQAS